MLIDNDDYFKMCKFIYDSQNEESYNKDILMIEWADDIWYFSSKFWTEICIDKSWNWCKAWINVLWIQSNWNVLWCLSLPDCFIEWNIKDRSIIDIWNDENSFSFSRYACLDDLWENCKWCPHWEICKWWCNEISYSRTWKIHNSPFCLYRSEKESDN